MRSVGNAGGFLVNLNRLGELVAWNHSKLGEVSQQDGSNRSQATIAPAILTYLRENPCHVTPPSLQETDQNAENWSSQVFDYLVRKFFLKI